MVRIAALAVALLLPTFATSTCTLNCTKPTCFASPSDVLDCLENVPFNKTWAEATIDTLTQSLEAGYGFKALMHDTGPPYEIQVDLLTELKGISDSYTSQFAFEEAVQATLIKTLDAHTRYSKPMCFNATFASPLIFQLEVSTEKTKSGQAIENVHAVLQPSAFFSSYIAENPTYVDTLNQLVGQELITVNGKEWQTEVHFWGSTHDSRSNNPGARFNSAIRSYLFRSAISYPIYPGEDVTSLTFTTAEGSFTMPWLGVYGPNLGDANSCVDSDVSFAVSNKQKVIIDGAAELKSLHDKAEDSRKVIIDPGDAEFQISCFTQTLDTSEGTDADTAGISNVLVMKVSSFSPNSPNSTNYTDAWAGFVGDAQKCLSVDFDMIVVDVMQNGGGYVCMGIRLMELLVEDFYNDHTLTQMKYDLPHSKLMDAYINAFNYNQPYINPKDVEEILDPATQESYPDGQAWYNPGYNVTQGGVVSHRSNIFSLDCRLAEAMPSTPQNWKPKFLPASHLVILTDGTCGSTCACFTKVIQESNKATFVGVGGLWGEPMDVSSFAGGFVSNPGYLQNIAKKAKTVGEFPNFITNQHWQFDWAVWYSARFPGRPAQFTQQEPNFRTSFWNFPHPSVDESITTSAVSNLYDSIIDDNVARIAASVNAGDGGDSCDNNERFFVTVGIILTALFFGTMLYFLKHQGELAKRKYASKQGADLESSTLTQSLLSK